jgi:hypothetical protein
MKRMALLTVLLAVAGFSALYGCSGPTPPKGDAGFFGTAPTWGTGGSYGAGGSYGTGGFYGTGGAFGGGNLPRLDGGQEEERRRDGGGGPGGGNQGGGPPNRRRDAGPSPDLGPSPDAAPVAECPTGAMDGETCMMGQATCMISAGDGGRGAICTCRERRGEGTWRCETP